jgi:uncharacterized protein (DUF58 family)
MDRADLIRKIREIEISSIAFSNQVFSGEYHSYFKGNGMEFAGIRAYAEGDDVKKIDWKMSAKHKKTYVKEYVEERELLLYLMIDISKSNILGKSREFLTELAGILAFSAVKTGDKVGLVLFSDGIEKFIPAKKGKNHALAILEDVYSYESKGRGTNIKNTLCQFEKHIKKKSIVIMLSDFLDDGFQREMGRLSMKHDFIPLCIRHGNLEKLPFDFLYRLRDSESGKEVLCKIGAKERDYGFKHKNFLSINSEEDYLKKLILYFKKRRSR